ncbi:MAG: signal peptidase I [Ignavibacteriae bacterium]|nr:signal peptidase I [Ignavibacteria bacterium]MBI3364792.1 signal peptidase I [Ignavibacteriota bacterium]
MKIFVLGAIHVPSRSMEGTLLDGDYVLVNKLIYGARVPQHLPFTRSEFPLVHVPALRRVERGDVVVFEFPVERTTAQSPTYFVKRCVAVGGDKIAVRDGSLFVNEKKIVERQRPGDLGEFFAEDLGSTTIPRSGDIIELTSETKMIWKDIVRKDGHRLSLGHSSETFIDGKQATTYRVEKNYLLVLGDNIAHSYDSRHWGFLSEENVVGEAMMVYWSVSPSAVIRWERIGKFVE